MELGNLEEALQILKKIEHDMESNEIAEEEKVIFLKTLFQLMHNKRLPLHRS